MSHMSISSTCPSESRRMSEPTHITTDRKTPPPRPSSVQLSPLKPNELHPNQEVILDEVGEGEMVENKLVIPDEMVHYLNQVADINCDVNLIQNLKTEELDWQPNLALDEVSQMAQMLPSPPNLTQLMSPASNMSQIMPSPRTNLNQMVPSPNLLSPGLQQMSPASNLNQMLGSPASNLNQMMGSPASNLNQMIGSPASNLNQMIGSPASNLNQMIGSPASNLNQMIGSPASNLQQMSPASNLNQMIGSPASNLNQMIGSPASNLNQMIPSPASNLTQLMPYHQMSPQSQMIGSPASNISQMMPSPGMQHQIKRPEMMQPNMNQNFQEVPCNCGNCQNQCLRTQYCYRQNQFYTEQRPQYVPNPNYDPNMYIRPQQIKSPPMYNYCPNYNEPAPLTSPAMATPAPVQSMNQQQPAQMSRCPPSYYQFSCNCQKDQQCFHHADGIQCRDQNQSQQQQQQQQPPPKPNNEQSSGGSAALSMRQDAYQRTLEYVQNCQSWVENPDVSGSTHPPTGVGNKCEQTSSNMVINDMTSSLSSLLEENRFLQLIQ